MRLFFFSVLMGQISEEGRAANFEAEKNIGHEGELQFAFSLEFAGFLIHGGFRARFAALLPLQQFLRAGGHGG